MHVFKYGVVCVSAGVYVHTCESVCAHIIVEVRVTLKCCSSGAIMSFVEAEDLTGILVFSKFFNLFHCMSAKAMMSAL